MTTQQESESRPSDVEEEQRSRQGSVGNEITKRWKKAAFIFGAAAIVLLAGLATSLGIFLTNTECQPPPSRGNATTTYLGSASPGTKVTYVCQPPLLFPDNSPSFTLTCTDALKWEPKDIPSCGIYTTRVCSPPDLSLTLAGRPSTSGLEIEITLQGPPPASLQVDIPTYDDTLCTYDGAVEGSIPTQTSRTKPPTQLAASGEDEVVVAVVFESVDPWAPYEVRLRSIGTKLAVTVLQEDITAIALTSFSASMTTPDVSDAANTTTSEDTTNTLTSMHTAILDTTLTSGTPNTTNT